LVDCKLLWSVCICKNDKENGSFKNDYFITGFGNSYTFNLYSMEWIELGFFILLGVILGYYLSRKK